MKCQVVFMCFNGSITSTSLAHSPQNLEEPHNLEREDLVSYFPRTSKAENYVFLMWKGGWHMNNPRRLTWDPAPNFYLVTLDLSHDPISLPVSSGISRLLVHSHCALCCFEAGRMGEG